MKQNLAPVLLFVYNRPTQTRLTLEALSQNELADQSVLYIYADGPKKGADLEDIRQIQEVRQLIKERKWCGEVHILESDLNKGLANSIIQGVTERVEEYGTAIILEDDLVTARGFLNYMNNGLTKYAHDDEVMHICGFQFPLEIPARNSALFLQLAVSWGWATWRRAWKHFDRKALGYERLKSETELARRFDINGTIAYTDMLMKQMEQKTIDSWAIRWWWAIFKRNGVALFPDNSLVLNIGYGGGATHTKEADPFGDPCFREDYMISDFPEKVEVDQVSFLKLQRLNQKVYMLNSSKLSKLLRKVERKALALLRRV